METLQEYRARVLKQANAFPVAGIPDWVVAFPLVTRLMVLHGFGGGLDDEGVEKLRFLSGFTAPDWSEEPDLCKVAEMLIKDSLAVIEGFHSLPFAAQAFAVGVLTANISAVAPLLPEGDLQERLEDASDQLFDTLAYEY